MIKYGVDIPVQISLHVDVAIDANENILTPGVEETIRARIQQLAQPILLDEESDNPLVMSEPGEKAIDLENAEDKPAVNARGYLDTRQDRTVFVSDGISKGDHYCSFWRRLDATGGTHRMKSPNLPERDTFVEAQEDLDEYAKSRNWPEIDYDAAKSGEPINAGTSTQEPTADESVVLIPEPGESTQDFIGRVKKDFNELENSDSESTAQAEQLTQPTTDEKQIKQQSPPTVPPPLSEIIRQGDFFIKREESRTKHMAYDPIEVLDVDREKSEVRVKIGITKFTALDQFYRLVLCPATVHEDDLLYNGMVTVKVIDVSQKLAYLAQADEKPWPVEWDDLDCRYVMLQRAVVENADTEPDPPVEDIPISSQLKVGSRIKHSVNGGAGEVMDLMDNAASIKWDDKPNENPEWLSFDVINELYELDDQQVTVV